MEPKSMRLAGSQKHARMWNPQRPSLFAVSAFLLYSSLSVSIAFSRTTALLNLGVRGPSRFSLWISVLHFRKERFSDWPSLVRYYLWTKQLCLGLGSSCSSMAGENLPWGLGPSFSFTISQATLCCCKDQIREYI